MPGLPICDAPVEAVPACERTGPRSEAAVHAGPQVRNSTAALFSQAWCRAAQPSGARPDFASDELRAEFALFVALFATAPCLQW
jgi:hypothetical protein